MLGLGGEGGGGQLLGVADGGGGDSVGGGGGGCSGSGGGGGVVLQTGQAVAGDDGIENRKRKVAKTENATLWVLHIFKESFYFTKSRAVSLPVGGLTNYFFTNLENEQIR